MQKHWNSPLFPAFFQAQLSKLQAEKLLVLKHAHHISLSHKLWEVLLLHDCVIHGIFQAKVFESSVSYFLTLAGWKIPHFQWREYIDESHPGPHIFIPATASWTTILSECNSNSLSASLFSRKLQLQMCQNLSQLPMLGTGGVSNLQWRESYGIRPYNSLQTWVDEFIPYLIWKLWEFRPWHKWILMRLIFLFSCPCKRRVYVKDLFPRRCTKNGLQTRWVLGWWIVPMKTFWGIETHGNKPFLR